MTDPFLDSYPLESAYKRKRHPRCLFPIRKDQAERIDNFLPGPHAEKSFNLLDLIYPIEDVSEAYRNFSAGIKKSIDDAIELCDVFLERELRDLIIPLIEDVPIGTKVMHFRKMLKRLERSEIP